MTDFIDIQRRFVDLTDATLDDIELLLSLSEHEFRPSIGWSELLESPSGMGETPRL